VTWIELFERERMRYDDGVARLAPEQLVRIGNAAYGAGLALLMLGRNAEAGEWLDRAAARWRESWEHATPTSWGRPLGAIKAAAIARRDSAADYARWALELGSAEAESSIGRYAATLAELVLCRGPAAAVLSATLQEDDEFPSAVAGALVAIAEGDSDAYALAVEAVLVSFESRDDYLEGVPVADTVLALQTCAGGRGITVAPRPSPLLPGQVGA
jgi:hypothetical protein